MDYRDTGNDYRCLRWRRPDSNFRACSGGAANNGAGGSSANNGPGGGSSDDGSASPDCGGATNRDSDGFPPHGYSRRRGRPGGHADARPHANPGSGAGGTTQD